MKKILAIVVLVSMAISATALSFPTPTAELKRFEVDAISLRDITFLFTLAVKNPYPLGLTFDGMTLAFSVEGAKVFTAASRGGFSVPANRSKSNTFTVTLTYEDIFKVVKDYASKDYLNTVIDGTLTIPLPKIPGLPKKFSFSYKLKKKIPAIKPQIGVLDFAVVPPTAAQVRESLVKAGSKVDAGKALGALKNVLEGKKPGAAVIDPAEIDVPVSVSFTIELVNQAKAVLAFSRLGYELYVNGEKLVVGETAKVTREEGRSLISVTNTFSSRRLSEGVRDFFSHRKGTFRLVGSSSIKLPDEIRVTPVPLAFEEQGSFWMK
jgi:LEA14-like dessication related protein